MIQGARCLDCFAGSGALGLEALSRYASETTLLEADRQVAKQLSDNLTLLKAENGQVVNTNSLQWLAQPGQPFNLVFLDPPFRKGLLAETINLLEQFNWLAADAWIYVEAEAESAVADVPANWLLHREKSPGRLPIVYLFANKPICQHVHRWQSRSNTMWINLGRLLMLGVWFLYC